MLSNLRGFKWEETKGSGRSFGADICTYKIRSYKDVARGKSLAN